MLSRAPPSIWLLHILYHSRNFCVSPVGLSVCYLLKSPVALSPALNVGLSLKHRIMVTALLKKFSTQVTLLGEHALDVVEGFIVRLLRFLVEMLDGFWSSSMSTIASALASPRSRKKGSFVSVLLLLTSDPSTGLFFLLV